MQASERNFEKRGVKDLTIPKISVIMSVYNGEQYLSEAIESIRGQTFKDWEFIIINDCSTDKTEQILNDYAARDGRIRVYKNEVNLKLPASLNKAVKLARGEYTARMDADDICLPCRFEKQYDFMKSNPDIALSSCRFMTLKGGAAASGGGGGRCDSESVKALLLFTNPVLHPGVIAKSEVMKAMPYDTSLTCTEDLELWTRMAMKGYRIEIQNEYLMLYRIHEKQITSTTVERQRKEVLEIQRKYYSTMLKPIDRGEEDFYICGIYFKERRNAESFRKFFKWIKGVNGKEKRFDKTALNYAALEVSAEYKRCGIPRGELIKCLLCFNIGFLAKEIPERKKRARRDGLRCIRAAESIGFLQTGGTVEFPIFSKPESRGLKNEYI